MENSYQHKCIKISCNAPYTDNDPDNYFCSNCQIENKKIALKIDSQLSTRTPRQIKSDLQEYNESPKVHGFVRVRL